MTVDHSIRHELHRNYQRLCLSCVHGPLLLLRAPMVFWSSYDGRLSTVLPTRITLSVPVRPFRTFMAVRLEENLSRRFNFVFCISQMHVHDNCYIPRMFQVPSATLKTLGKSRLNRWSLLSGYLHFNAMVCEFASIRMEYTRNFLLK